MTAVGHLYAAVADDLALVEDALSLAARSDFAPLETMLTQVLARGGKRLQPTNSRPTARCGADRRASR